MLHGSTASVSDGTCCNGSSLAAKNNVIASDSNSPLPTTESVLSCSCSTKSELRDTAAADGDDVDDGLSQIGGKEKDIQPAAQLRHILPRHSEELCPTNEQMIQRFNEQIEVFFLLCS